MPSTEHRTLSTSEEPGCVGVTIETQPRRGIVPTRIPRKLLYSVPIKLQLGELPRWKPRVTGDCGRATRENE